MVTLTALIENYTVDLGGAPDWKRDLEQCTDDEGYFAYENVDGNAVVMFAVKPEHRQVAEIILNTVKPVSIEVAGA